MQAVSFPGPGCVEIVDIPRPSLIEPSDAIVLVTTAAIGPWDIERFESIGSEQVVPGGEFAGIIVEIGSEVRTVELDDLVCNTAHLVNRKGHSRVFGTTSVAGGHAEYVRVPNADAALVKISDSVEERVVLAGGTIGLGINAAAVALQEDSGASYAVVGCDPIGVSALIGIKNSGHNDNLIAVDDHAARRTLAGKYAEEAYSGSDDLANATSDIVMVGAMCDFNRPDLIAQLVKPDGTIVFAEPYGPSRIVTAGTNLPEGVKIMAASWPNKDDVRKIVSAIQIRQLDLTPIVSHVIPLDEALDAYKAASGPEAGVQKVLLKP
ncbi:MAG TPA: hypothetical protein DHV68_09130 [Dehalococcoidia bacterium]|nr:hypothetical protein [Dehalococcoidia bacterium]|tara:strand:- start:1028 stop:1993 length:966 start_codon:yes stop_codon:yes gene_type:complete